MKYNDAKHGRAEYGSYVQISKDYWDALQQEPLSGLELKDQYFARTVHVTNQGEATSGIVNIEANTDYQDTVLNNQITLSAGNQQITSFDKRGYVKLRVSAGGTCYIGNDSVATSSGYLLDDDYPVESLTFEDLSDVYVRGSGTLYVIGGYIA